MAGALPCSPGRTRAGSTAVTSSMALILTATTTAANSTTATGTGDPLSASRARASGMNSGVSFYHVIKRCLVCMTIFSVSV